MPIYAYRCESCGHSQDVLQKISDAPLSNCPACGAATFSKQITAAGFQLKGSGWYATDFKGSSSSKPGPADATQAAPPATTSTEESGTTKAAAHTCGSGACGACS